MRVRTINPTVYFDMGEPDLEVFNKLPGGDSDWAVKNRITKGIDFVGLKLYQLLGGAPVPQAAPNQATEEQVDAAVCKLSWLHRQKLGLLAKHRTPRPTA